MIHYASPSFPIQYNLFIPLHPAKTSPSQLFLTNSSSNRLSWFVDPEQPLQSTILPLAKNFIPIEIGTDHSKIHDSFYDCDQNANIHHEELIDDDLDLRVGTFKKKMDSMNSDTTNTSNGSADLFITSNSIPSDKDDVILYMYYQNVRGLRTKINDFFIACLSSDYDVIVLTETWLKPSIYDSELFNSSFMVYRCDRSHHNCVFNNGGGVLVAVKSRFSSEIVDVPNTLGVEFVAVKISFQKFKLFVCCVYIPSGASQQMYTLYETAFSSLFNVLNLNIEDKLIIVGDFNLPSVNWSFDIDNMNVLLPIRVSIDVEGSILYNILGNGLQQLNNCFNHQNRLLDLLFANCADVVKVVPSACPLSRIDPYHVPIDITISIPTENNQLTYSSDITFNFRKGNYRALNSYYNSLNWDELYVHSNIDVVVDIFYEKLFTGFIKHIPVVKLKNSRHPPWIDRTILRLKNRRSKAFKKYKLSNSAIDYIVYSRIRAQCASALSKAYKIYLAKTQESLIEDASHFWRYFNSRRKINSIPSTMVFNGQTRCDIHSICELFAEFFKSVYVEEQNQENIIESPMSSKFINIGHIQFESKHVLEALMNLDIKKGIGPDKVSPILLQECADH